MKNRIMVLMFTAIVAFAAPLMAEKFIFTEYGVSYASMLSPGNLQNNTTGTYDSGIFDAKVGVSALRWAELYIGGAFSPFIFHEDPQENYSFFPIYGGIRANICPQWIVYPSVMFEYGTAAANLHTRYAPDPADESTKFGRDNAWRASYYNFGIGINWNVEDIAVLSLKIERPSYSSIKLDKNSSEIHIFKAGLAWQIYY